MNRFLSQPDLFVFDVSHTVENATGKIVVNDYRATVARSITFTRMELYEIDRATSDRAEAIAYKMAEKAVNDNRALKLSAREEV